MEDWMDNELGAVTLNNSGCTRGAEYMCNVCPLRAQRSTARSSLIFLYHQFLKSSRFCFWCHKIWRRTIVKKILQPTFKIHFNKSQTTYRFQGRDHREIWCTRVFPASSNHSNSPCIASSLPNESNGCYKLVQSSLPQLKASGYLFKTRMP